MDKEPNQISLSFSDEGNGQKEFLSGGPVESQPPKKTRGRKSLKEKVEDAEPLNIPSDDQLYQKQYYAIGEVAQMFGVNASLLRYWESEFGMELRKNRKGDRFFRPEDIKTLQLIHDLLRRRKFTLEGARDFLKQNKKAEENYQMIQSLQKIRSFLLELRAHL